MLILVNIYMYIKRTNHEMHDKIATITKGLGVSTVCFPFNQPDSWQQLNCHTLLATQSPLSGHEKTRETRND